MLRGQLVKGLRSIRWVPVSCWQRVWRRVPSDRPVHLIIALADHFEPSFVPGGGPEIFASLDEQERRVEDWCKTYPRIASRFHDVDGRPLRHTYFFPAEQYEKALIERLAEHCRAGWGEIEVHLHHGINAPDTAENTRKTLLEFRNALVRHGCLSSWEGDGQPRYAFVHGNWALANSAGGRYCGVDDEMQILAETGCYADCTLPSAPDRAQIAKINNLYECTLPLDRRAAHRGGLNLRCGRAPKIFPLIVQGPLGLRPRGPSQWGVPGIENGELAMHSPPTLDRLRSWERMAITVEGRPDWIYVKLHCHGMDPKDESVMLGPLMEKFLDELSREASRLDRIIHFVTTREMVNIILASCDGCDGDPGSFRDYRLWPMGVSRSGQGSSSA